MVESCTCAGTPAAAEQDRMYGKGRRVFTERRAKVTDSNGKTATKIVPGKCTVCGREHKHGRA